MYRQDFERLMESGAFGSDAMEALTQESKGETAGAAVPPAQQWKCSAGHLPERWQVPPLSGEAEGSVAPTLATALTQEREGTFGSFGSFVMPPPESKNAPSESEGTFEAFEAFVPPSPKSKNAPSEAETWETPIPFTELCVPDFPLACLPREMADFASALSTSTQTPTEMVGLLSLGVLAATLQARFTVEITPDWREPLCLYCAAVANPGERKSAVLSALTKPIIEYEGERRAAEEVELAQNRTERQLLESSLEAAKACAAKGKGDYSSKRKEALDLSAQLAAFRDRHPFRLLVDDTTPEKLVEVMDAQGGCITVCSAEGGVFDTMGGRYDKSSGNVDIYLKGHAGDSIAVDRIGRRGNSIAHPRLTMLLTIQPEVLNGLMSNATFKGRGLCGRFLYAMCQTKIGHREVAPAPISSEKRTEYRNFVRRLLTCSWGGTIHLSPEADRLRMEFQRQVERKLGEQWEFMRDWGGKATGAMVRIAALLHAASCAENPVDTPIQADIMARAISIAKVLCSHAEAAYQRMGSDPALESARYLLRRAQSSGQAELSKRELFQLCKGHFRRVENLESALRVLCNMGYLREQVTSTGGRPSKKIRFHPALYRVQ